MTLAEVFYMGYASANGGMPVRDFSIVSAMEKRAIEAGAKAVANAVTGSLIEAAYKAIDDHIEEPASSTVHRGAPR